MKILKFVLFAAVLYLLYLILSKIGFELILVRLKYINLWIVGLAFFVSLIHYLLTCFRWKLILDRIIKLPYLSLVPYMFVGQFISSITPGVKLGGEPVRSYFLSKKTGVSQSKLLATIVLDKFFNVLVFFFFLLLVLAYMVFFVSMPQVFHLFFEIIFLIVLLLMVFFFVFRKSLRLIYFEWILVLLYKIWFIRRKWEDYKTFKEYIVTKAKSFYNVFNESFDDKRVLYKALLITLLVWIFCYSTTYLLFLSFGYEINFLIMVVAVTIAIFFGDISFVPGGLAVTEGVAIVMYFFLGVNLVVAAGVVLLERLIYYVISAGIGGPIFGYLHFKK